MYFLDVILAKTIRLSAQVVRADTIVHIARNHHCVHAPQLRKYPHCRVNVHFHGLMSLAYYTLPKKKEKINTNEMRPKWVIRAQLKCLCACGGVLITKQTHTHTHDFVYNSLTWREFWKYCRAVHYVHPNWKRTHRKLSLTDSPSHSYHNNPDNRQCCGRKRCVYRFDRCFDVGC